MRIEERGQGTGRPADDEGKKKEKSKISESAKEKKKRLYLQEGTQLGEDYVPHNPQRRESETREKEKETRYILRLCTGWRDGLPFDACGCAEQHRRQDE